MSQDKPKRNVLKNLRGLAAGFLFLIAAGSISGAQAHPHVFMDANLEVVRGADGTVQEIRHVWRFDEIFSASLLLDFDENGNGQLDEAELATIATETKQSLAEFNFFTEVRLGDKPVDLYEPEPYIADVSNGQLVIIMAMTLDEPVNPSDGLRISVSDPTYYVAVDLPDEKAVHMSGNAKGCSWKIERPDYDALLARDQQSFLDSFANGEDVFEATDEYLTWVDFTCA